MTLHISIDVHYAECHAFLLLSWMSICCVSHFFLLLCWMSVGWVSHFLIVMLSVAFSYCCGKCRIFLRLSWKSLYWVLLCCVSLCWVPLCCVSLCWVSLCWLLGAEITWLNSVNFLFTEFTLGGNKLVHFSLLKQLCVQNITSALNGIKRSSLSRQIVNFTVEKFYTIGSWSTTKI